MDKPIRWFTAKRLFCGAGELDLSIYKLYPLLFKFFLETDLKDPTEIKIGFYSTLLNFLLFKIGESSYRILYSHSTSLLILIVSFRSFNVNSFFFNVIFLGDFANVVPDYDFCIAFLANDTFY